MKTRNSETKSKSGTTKLQAWIAAVAIVITVGLLAIPAWLYFKADSQASGEFTVVNNAMEEIRRNTMNHAGAVERAEVAAKVYDNFYDLFDCIDEICPKIQRSFFVPIEAGQERAFLSKLLSDNGYGITHESSGSRCQPYFLGSCYIDGDKTGLHASVQAHELGPIQPPDRIITPKIWRYVLVNVRKSD